MKYLVPSIYVLTSAILLIYWGVAAAPVLSYEEGWSTFYYDSDILSMMYSDMGVGGCVRAFLLQFFTSGWSWIGAILLTLISGLMICACHFFLSRIKKLKWGACLASVLIAVCFAYSITSWLTSGIVLSPIGIGSVGEQNNYEYKYLSDISRKGDWDSIISKCEDKRVTNQLLQNILNMALAEKLELGDRLLDQPVSDIRSIYIADIENPELAGLLSDVYYSMGHIAQSQMYAFEANEKKNNLSPRMLQRLTITNILYGEKNVARKYLYILSKTLCYKDWAEQYLAILNGKADLKFTRQIAEKRRCIFPDNRFSGIKGLDDDLLNVARNTRGTNQCRITLQYLGSLYILAGYQEQFKSMIEEFGGSKDMPKPLPSIFEKFYNHLNKSNNTEK